ncbi:type I-E CRISPR-associated protein Cas6/Cse3/CasE [Vreelandella jeotgali]|uniref:type I-E CRISPR-associated protein Cas6/Cse3/CasE n=1 Tax=Vreelandella jeotgali TaxID=553386 RepID=UPI0003456053|nr:type I-E CRISPR-associated protein Cas6/Cse3/CasE [Halomonas jeotgali]
MYLSRVRVDLNNLSRSMLFNVMAGEAYSAHQLLWRLFPEHDGERPFLFRQEMDETEHESVPKGLPLFYVLSPKEPVSVEGLLSVESKPFAPDLRVGDRLAFRLRANPTVAKAVNGKRGHRADVLMAAKKPFSRDQRKSLECRQAMDDAARAWLTQRASGAGFTLPVKPELGAYRQHVLNKGGDQQVQFSSVDYEGLLEVQDPAALMETLANGLGRAKAFGCGLFLLRRP